MTFDITVLMNSLVFAGIIAVAVVYLRSQVQRQAHQEVEDLAETRGNRITDLQTEIADMQTVLARMQGQIDGLYSLKTEEIIEGVTNGIRDLVIALKAT